MTASVLRIQSASDGGFINFIDSHPSLSAYKLFDNTLDIGTPEVNAARSASVSYGGSPIRDIQLMPRKIGFDFMVVGTNENEVIESLRQLMNALGGTVTRFHFDGGAYSATSEYVTANRKTFDTGQQGSMLHIGLNPGSTGTTVKRENGLSESETLIFSTRILLAEITLLDSYANSSNKITLGGSNVYQRQYHIELECDPYFTLPARSVVGTNGDTRLLSSMYSGGVDPYAGYTGRYNRIFIDGNQVDGTHPAPTRISFNVNGGWGALIARDAGISALNSPSSPVFAGTGKDDLLVSGQYVDVDAGLGMKGKKIVIKIVSLSPDKFQYSTDGGSSWSASINVDAGGIQSTTHTVLNSTANSTNISITFGAASGHVVNDTWTFYSHQAYIPVDYTRDVYANRSDAYSESGFYLTGAYINIPQGCRSRYKVYVRFSASGYVPEFAMSTAYAGFSASYSSHLYSGNAKYDWTLPGSGSDFADLGIIDFTASGTPALAHPYVGGKMLISIYTRSVDTITNPASCTIGWIYLIPCQDDNSWIHAAWTDDGAERETFCNYDQLNPYMAETKIADTTFGTRYIMPLNGTYGGNFITLIPDVDNTILCFPIFSTQTDWRRSSIPSGSTNDSVHIAYRPIYTVI